MAKGNWKPRICVLCKTILSKNRDDQYAHLREKHGAKALTKAKALEIYPDGKMSSLVAASGPAASVWVVEFGDDGGKGMKTVAIYDDNDLLVMGMFTGPPPPIRTERPSPPPASPPTSGGLVAYIEKLKEIQTHVDQIKRLLGEVLGG